MRLLLFVGVQFSLYAIAYAVVRGLQPETRSYLIGSLHMLALLVIALITPRLFFYFLKSESAELTLGSRVRLRVNSDWKTDQRGWDVDWLRVQTVRNHEQGTLIGCVALLGFHFHVALLVDPIERDTFMAHKHAELEAHIASMPMEVQMQMREMLKNMPLGSVVSVGAIRVPHDDIEDDEDDDQDKTNQGPVH
jgi:hypothetical protein